MHLNPSEHLVSEAPAQWADLYVDELEEGSIEENEA